MIFPCFAYLCLQVFRSGDFLRLWTPFSFQVFSNWNVWKIQTSAFEVWSKQMNNPSTQDQFYSRFCPCFFSITDRVTKLLCFFFAIFALVLVWQESTLFSWPKSVHQFECPCLLTVNVVKADEGGRHHNNDDNNRCCLNQFRNFVVLSKIENLRFRKGPTILKESCILISIICKTKTVLHCLKYSGPSWQF